MAERDVQIVDRAHRRAVHDPGAAQALNQLAQLAQLVGFARDLADVERQVGTVKRHAAHVRVAHAQLHQNVIRDRRGRGRGQRQDGGSPQHLGCSAQSQVRRSKIVSPLRHAVRFVDREQREFHALQGSLNRRRADRFGRDDAELDRPLTNGFEIGRPFLGGSGGIDARDANAERGKLADLILDQRQQGRHHQSGTGKHQRRELIGQRFTAAGRHDRQRVAPGQHRFDDLGLPRPKAAHLEDLAEFVQRRPQGRRGRRWRRGRRHMSHGGRRRWTRAGPDDPSLRQGAVAVGIAGPSDDHRGDAVVRNVTVRRASVDQRFGTRR